MKKKIFYVVLGVFGFLFLIALTSSFSPNETAKPVVQPPPPTDTSITVAPVQTTTPQQNKSAVTEISVTQPTPEPTSDLFSVTQVVDGDTIKVSIDGSIKTVRLIGIDTPETVDPRKPVQCFGLEASNKAKTTLSGKKVRLESDSTQGDLDKYGRLLRYVFLEDGTFLNKMMISQGYAHEYTYDTPYQYQTEFKAAEKAARESQSGLWSPSTCGGNTNSTTTTQTQPAQSGSHTFYLSTYYTAKFYYCDTDDGWKSLSEKYLKSYPSEQELLNDYSGRTLHEPCK